MGCSLLIHPVGFAVYYVAAFAAALAAAIVAFIAAAVTAGVQPSLTIKQKKYLSPSNMAASNCQTCKAPAIHVFVEEQMVSC